MRQHYVSSVWQLGTAACRLALTRRGFSARETERLIALKIRYEGGKLHFVTHEDKRLRFARWLVANGYLTDEIIEGEERSLAA